MNVSGHCNRRSLDREATRKLLKLAIPTVVDGVSHTIKRGAGSFRNRCDGHSTCHPAATVATRNLL